MKALLRRKEMYQYISAKNIVTIAELKEHFKVSEVTIRSDLDYLEKLNMIERMHGKAKIISKEEDIAQLPDTPLLEEKLSICKKGAQYIKPGDTLFLDSSATSLILAGFLADLPNLTVITNSLQIINKLKHSDAIHLYAIPGQYTRINSSFTGPLAESFISHLKTGKAFISPKGILEDGLRDLTADEAAIRRAMIHSTKEAVVLADNSKFGNEEEVLFQISDFSSISAVITDKMPPEPFPQLFRENQIELIISETKEEDLDEKG